MESGIHHPDKAARTGELPTSFEPLKRQIQAAAEAFATEAHPLAEILGGLVDDVERAAREPLEIIPVAHHSPSSALQVVRRLRQRPPRLIFLECCEDLRPLLDGLRDCKLPVALQAFAASSDAFPPSWSPLNLVCPLTDFSAEFQAIGPVLGIAHPTGYPAYTLLAWLASVVLQPFGNEALRAPNVAWASRPAAASRSSISRPAAPRK